MAGWPNGRMAGWPDGRMAENSPSRLEMSRAAEGTIHPGIAGSSQLGPFTEIRVIAPIRFLSAAAGRRYEDFARAHRGPRQAEGFDPAGIGDGADDRETTLFHISFGEDVAVAT
jgi:hypothetical protein